MTVLVTTGVLHFISERSRIPVEVSYVVVALAVFVTVEMYDVEQ